MTPKPLPLAAALLLCAAVTQAQPFPAPSGSSTGNLLQLGGNNSFSLAPSGVADDMIFKCSTVPYRPCTTEEMNKRELILETGRCPSPITTACTDFLMMRAGAGATQLLGNQANPSTANDDFYKKCGTVPYRNCSPAEEKQREEWLKNQSKADSQTPPPGAVCDANSCTMPTAPVQGPPQVVNMPTGFDGKMLQYPDGRVEYCFDDSCSKTNGTPLAPDQARSYLWNDYKDQKQMANSINGGAANRKAAVPQDPPADVVVNTPVNPSGSGTKSGGSSFSAFSTPVGGNNASSGSSASEDATDVSNAQDQINGGGSRSVKGAGGGGSTVASSGDGSGAGSGGTGSTGSNTSPDGSKMVKVKAASLDGTYTYQALMPAVETTVRAGEAIKAGQTEFVAPDGTNVNTKGGELKVDENKLGKIQASHQ